MAVAMKSTHTRTLVLVLLALGAAGSALGANIGAITDVMTAAAPWLWAALAAWAGWRLFRARRSTKPRHVTP